MPNTTFYIVYWTDAAAHSETVDCKSEEVGKWVMQGLRMGYPLWVPKESVPGWYWVTPVRAMLVKVLDCENFESVS